MIIKSVYLKEGLFERKIEFSPTVTFIHSKNNSCGKTTLLRFMLYGLGYNVPNTKRIKFQNCEVIITVECEKLGIVSFCRNDASSIVLKNGNSENTYVLPEQQQELHSELFGTDNRDILSNLLGAFYVDQEKGWTLLNRGKVIGSIGFNIEELIRGLSGRDCTELIKKIAQLQREKEKYKQMSSVAQYRASLEVDSASVATDSYEDTVDAEMSSLLLQQGQIKKELKRIDGTLSENNKFRKFISDMKLLVQSPEGTVFPVKEENIVGLNDSIELLITKRKMVSHEYAAVSAKIERLEKEKDSEYEQLAFFQLASQLEIFDRKILRMPLNPKVIKSELDRLEKQIKALQDELSRATRIDNSVVKEVSDSIIAYGTELGIGDTESIPRTYLFTSNLKELSGALLHKTAFAFRLAYITALEKALNIKLPILLDSPSGKEVDQNNIALMMDILKRDFSDHQIIIASIFTYDFENALSVEIKDRLIDTMIEA